jgi:hypothetical protein
VLFWIAQEKVMQICHRETMSEFWGTVNSEQIRDSRELLRIYNEHLDAFFAPQKTQALWFEHGVLCSKTPEAIAASRQLLKLQKQI